MTLSAADRPLPTLQTVSAHGPMPSDPLRTTGDVPLVAVDIAAFGDRRRDDDAQLYLRRALYDHLAAAFALTRLPWNGCHREDRGDGVLIVVPPEVDPGNLLDPLAHHLNAILRRSNRLRSDTGRLRMRLAVHTGRILHDDYGLAGHALVHLFRLLEAAAFKRALAASNADLGLVVSDRLHEDASARGGFYDVAAYRPLAIRCKETRTRGWLWLPSTGS